MNIKQIILFLMLIIVSSSVFANVTAVNIPSQYSNKSEAISYSVTYSGEGPVLLKISSQRNSEGLDYNFSGESGTNGLFIIDLSSGAVSSVNSSTGTPTIAVNSTDVVTISGNGFQDSITVDSIGPDNSASPTITPKGGSFNNFYSGTITVGDYASNLVDSNTYVDKHIIYLISANSLNYQDTIKTYIDANTVTSKDINSFSEDIDDGNYFVLIDANDIAGNFSSFNQVMATKKNIYFDNTKPVIGSVNLGTIDSNKIYIKDVPFDLNIVLSDISGIKGASSLNLITPKNPVNNILYNQGFNISSALISESLTGHTVVSGDIFRVIINAQDNVNNTMISDFNIIVDLNAPTRPTSNTTSIEDIDKNVTISWTNSSTDTNGSGLKEYRVYRGTSSNFSPITNQTLICTVALGGTYSCKDTSSKSSNTTLYYGVVAVDKAGNISDANVQSVRTGPSCSLEINDDEEYTRFSSVSLKLTYSNDVNEMAFSCNGTTFSTYEEADEDKNFTITSGNGCTSTSEEKIIYARVKTDDDEVADQRTTICSAEIYYDNVAPEIPTNITATTQTNGSIRLSWSSSEDQNTDSDVIYKIYYSLDNDVSNASSFLETDDTSYSHSPNVDSTVYYKLSAIDEAGNESALSATATGVSKKIGPDLTITITPSNIYDEVIYVGIGAKTIKYVSDETLKSAPQISIKQDVDSFVNVPATYDATTKSGQATFSFTKSGVGIIKIIATNNNNETATTELEFYVDLSAPNYSVDLNETDGLFLFNLLDYPIDVFRVQYILNDTDEICFKTIEDENYSCVFDSTDKPDGNYTISILVYDASLNITTKKEVIVINNIDEDQVLSLSLKEEIDVNISVLKENIDLFESLNLLNTIDPLLKTNYDLLLADISDADKLYADANFSLSKEKYTLIKDTISEFSEKLPKIEIIKTTTTEMIFDENTSIPLNLVLDSNVISETLELYKSKSISIIRTFDILQINSQKFLSITLTIKNTDEADKTITIIEDVPKSFSTDVAYLSFNHPIEVLIKDPVFKFTMTVPASSEKQFSYRYVKPITDVDIVTKQQNIKFENSVLLNGTVTKDKLNVVKKIDKNIFIYLILIIILFVVILLVVNGIVNYKNKHVKVEVKPDPKKEMSDYLGEIKTENKDNKELEETAKTVEVQKQNADKFQENYDYILSAIKKR